MADDATTASSASAKQDDKSSTPQDVVLKVLAAIGTGIGILGFVAFFGGALLWLRADKAELPANEVVAIIPNSVLVTTGTQFLVPALLIALGVLTVVCAVYLRFRLPKERKEAQRRKEAMEAKARAVEAMEKVEGVRGKADAANKSFAKLAALISEAPHDLAAVASMRTTADELDKEARQLEAEAREAEATVAQESALAKKLTKEAEAELERDPKHFQIELMLGALALFLIPPIANGAMWHVGLLLGLLLALTSAICAVVAIFIYRETQKFVWFGIVAFLAAGIYIGIATYINTNQNPKFEPVAALRTGHEPVTGVFIADTKENLYLGTFREPEQPPRMLVVPRSQLTELTVGPLLDPNVARRRAIAMALEECAQEVETPKTDTEPAQMGSACTEAQRAKLTHKAG